MNKNSLYSINGKKIVLFILYFSIIMETLIAEFKFPAYIRYINDVSIILLIYLLKKDKAISFFKRYNISRIISFIMIFFMISIFGAVINWVPMRLFFWGIRNTCRGMIFFLAVITYIDKKDIKKIFDNLFKLQIINLILALYQFIVLKHKMDDIGGIFGYGNGAGVNIFNALLITYYLNVFLWKGESLLKLVFSTFSAMIIAAVAEEKMTFLLCVIIFGISIIFSKFSLKKVVAVIIGFFGLVIGMDVLSEYYPAMYEVMMNMDLIFEYSQNTFDVGYKLPRIGSFPIISELFFKENINYLFGLGMGSCDTSNFAIFQSDFYNEFGHYNYRWFTHQWIFIEGGYVGFISYLCIFLYMLYFNMKKFLKNDNRDKKMMYIIGVILTGCCIIFIWYNPMLKIDVQYIAYFTLTLGFIEIKNKDEIEERSYRNE